MQRELVDALWGTSRFLTTTLGSVTGHQRLRDNLGVF